MPKIILYISYLYNTDTSVKRTLGSVPLVSVLKRFDRNYIDHREPIFVREKSSGDEVGHDRMLPLGESRFSTMYASDILLTFHPLSRKASSPGVSRGVMIVMTQFPIYIFSSIKYLCV